MDAKKARGVIGSRLSSVLQVDLFWHITQIHNSVVATLAVDVINFMLRPLAMHVEPSKSMGKISGTE